MITHEEADTTRAKHRAYLDQELEKASSKVTGGKRRSNAMFAPLSGTWQDMVWPIGLQSDTKEDCSRESCLNPETGVGLDVLRKVGKASVEVPEEFVSKKIASRVRC